MARAQPSNAPDPDRGRQDPRKLPAPAEASHSEALRPARGLLLGLAIGLAAWLLAAAAWWLLR